eukprot:5417419-Pyramimonas_sp.AAC.1
MIDEELKPWLLEVNASPSMSADTDTDRALKLGLLDDLLTVTDAENRFNGHPPRRPPPSPGESHESDTNAHGKEGSTVACEQT